MWQVAPKITRIRTAQNLSIAAIADAPKQVRSSGFTMFHWEKRGGTICLILIAVRKTKIWRHKLVLEKFSRCSLTEFERSGTRRHITNQTYQTLDQDAGGQSKFCPEVQWTFNKWTERYMIKPFLGILSCCSRNLLKLLWIDHMKVHKNGVGRSHHGTSIFPSQSLGAKPQLMIQESKIGSTKRDWNMNKTWIEVEKWYMSNQCIKVWLKWIEMGDVGMACVTSCPFNSSSGTSMPKVEPRMKLLTSRPLTCISGDGTCYFGVHVKPRFFNCFRNLSSVLEKPVKDKKAALCVLLFVQLW